LLKKLKRKFLITLAVAGLLYLAFTIYADFNKVIFTFGQFDWVLLPLLLFLSLLNYFTRFLKWNYYLSIIKVNIKIVDSFSIFMSGLIMSVTPGKVGELLKSYLVKEVTGVPVSKTAPVVFTERVTDFLSLLMIALFGTFAFNYGFGISISVSVFFIVVIYIISNKKLSLAIISFAERFKLVKKYITQLHHVYESSYQLLRPAPLIKMTLLSLISWSFECLGYYLILLNFDVTFGIFWASFSYAFAIIAGAISMLPGGLGITEGSLTFLLIERGVANEIAVTTTFLVRVVTLWFAVLIGIVSVSLYQKRFGKISIESSNNL